jgi:methylated-DNA-[protein]-cysteine S-methyltransferase
MRAEPNAAQPYQAVLASPLPDVPYLGLHIANGSLTAIDYLWHEASPTCTKQYRGVCERLKSYFSHRPFSLDVPLQPTGTPFQQRLWLRLQQIPSGEVITYGELARELGSSARAVAGGCRANPIPILIPCHRVVAANGLGGYMGKTEGREPAIKQWLLQHEGYV